MTIDDDIDAMHASVFRAVLQNAPKIVRDLLLTLDESVLYFFRTTVVGGYSGELQDDGSTVFTHIGTPIEYFTHSQGWWSGPYEVIDITARKTKYRRQAGKREWWPVFAGDTAPTEDGAIHGAGVDTDVNTRKRRAERARKQANPAERAKVWRRSEASVKGWATRKASPEYKAKAKRKAERDKKYKALKRKDPIKAAEFMRRSKAATKAAKTRKKRKP